MIRRISKVRKRDGRLVSFDETKIADAVHKAACAVGSDDRFLADELAGVVTLFLEKSQNVAARGGNWYLSKLAAAIDTKAIRYDRSLRASTIGFRCAVDGDVVRNTPGATGSKD